ncbi:hypothetical protein D3C87_1215990 [compost metagenome]
MLWNNWPDSCCELPGPAVPNVNAPGLAFKAATIWSTDWYWLSFDTTSTLLTVPTRFTATKSLTGS